MPVLRPARKDDVDAVVALVESAYRGEASRAGWTTEADLLDGQRTDPDGVREVLDALLVADDGAGGVGACCVLELDGDVGRFGMFAVRPGAQGRGTGSAVLLAAEQRAREQGARLVEMTVLSPRTELLAFYARRGYRPTGERRPFPYGQPRFGLPRRDDLGFLVLHKPL